MSGKPWHRRRRAFAAALALSLGGVLGYLARPVASGEETSADAGRKSSGPRFVGGPAEIDSPAPTKTRRRDSGGLSFSREQWAKIIETPGAYRLRLSDCTPDDMKRKTPGYFFDNIGKNTERDGPDLVRQMDLFGRDEAWAETVRKELLEFGKELAAAERSAAAFEYPGDGTLRFDFSGSEREKEELLGDLRKKLASAIGERDAVRLMALAGFERIPGYGGSSYEIRITPPTWLNNGNGELRASEEGGRMSTVLSRVQRGTVDPEFNMQAPGAESRVLHLDLQVDWLRLAIEATERYPVETE